MQEYPAPTRAHPIVSSLSISSMPINQIPFHIPFINLLHTGLLSTITLACPIVHPLSFKAAFTPSIQTPFCLTLPRVPSTHKTFFPSSSYHPYTLYDQATSISTHFFSTLPDRLLTAPTLLLISLFLILSLLLP